jgi:hypothetical protein
MDSKQLTIRVIAFLVGAIGIFLLAKRKNQNAWLWDPQAVSARSCLRFS